MDIPPMPEDDFQLNLSGKSISEVKVDSPIDVPGVSFKANTTLPEQQKKEQPFAFTPSTPAFVSQPDDAPDFPEPEVPEPHDSPFEVPDFQMNGKPAIAPLELPQRNIPSTMIEPINPQSSSSSDETPYPSTDEAVPTPPPLFSEHLPEGFTDGSEPVEDHLEKPKLRSYDSNAPLFITIEGYRRILADLDHVKNQLKHAEDVVGRLNELKSAKDKEFEKWRMELEDVQRKLLYVDKVIFET